MGVLLANQNREMFWMNDKKLKDKGLRWTSGKSLSA